VNVHAAKIRERFVEVKWMWRVLREMKMLFADA
jgi:hypothetical protein